LYTKEALHTKSNVPWLLTRSKITKSTEITKQLQVLPHPKQKKRVLFRGIIENLNLILKNKS
jgi:hypothetical protein